jgi:hypothetical protein
MKFGTYECYSNVYGCGYDNSTLRKNCRHPFVHDEKASLDEPYGRNLHLFHDQDELRAMDATLNLFTAERRNVYPWFNEVAACEHE